MASKEFLNERIQKTEEKIIKKENLIQKMEARIQKNLQKLEKLGVEAVENPYKLDRNIPNWEKAFDIVYSIDNAKDSIKNAQEQLPLLHKTLEKYKADLQVVIEKENSRNIKVILDFLQNWKEESFKYYQETLPRFLEARKQRYAENKEYCDWFNKGSHTKEERKERQESEHNADKIFNSTWNWFAIYVERSLLDEEKLQKDLNAEANRKYDFIIERTNELIGEITDASHLYLGYSGELNGFIQGKEGTVKVETIGAGGYNIQRYHFRTLINKVEG